ncbi:MAG: sodium:calcium antiporter [Lysobacteraceae bacterium SCN 69-123]|jgi:cation:H+ antiporter|nr:MAG: sodium:calcium antiporter [Xanthomonadaceae bacterium SCN 69-123]
MFAAGLVLLVLGADLLVRGASRLSLSLGISPLVVGLTVVAFGTSAPELAVSVQGAINGQGDIAIGNVVGSNIFNVLFILGLSALITPLVVHRQLVRKEVPIMIGVSLLMWALAVDGALGLFDGLLLTGLLIVYVVALYVQSRRAPAEETGEELPEGGPWLDRTWVQLLLIVAGLALLVLGSRWLVAAAIAFAQKLGISELVVGLTIVAAGTSLPEVATSIMAALKGQRDIAVGNVVGSNIFNILAVLGLTALVAPGDIPVASSALRFDIPIMIAVAVACLPVMFNGYRIERWEGGVFFLFYLAYTAWLVMYAQEHALLDEYRTVMVYGVLPLTALTLFVMTWRGWQLRRERLANAK